MVVSRIGEDDGSVHRTDVTGLATGHFDPMSVVLLCAPSHAVSVEPTLRWGRSEDAFAHRDGMITKAEVRTVALGKLTLNPAGVLWDVGAGSGSVGIEAAALAPRLQVFSIECKAQDTQRIAANAAAHGASITVVTGNAPTRLPASPTRTGSSSAEGASRSSTSASTVCGPMASSSPPTSSSTGRSPPTPASAT